MPVSVAGMMNTALGSSGISSTLPMAPAVQGTYRAGGHPSTRSGHVLKTCFNQTVLRMQNWQVAMRGSIAYCCQQIAASKL